MANFKLTQTGEQIQADLDLLDKNSATAGQVLTANGTGGASWQDASGGGTEVVANPTLAGTETDLTGLEVAGTKYKVPTGGSGGIQHLYKHTFKYYNLSVLSYRETPFANVNEFMRSITRYYTDNSKLSFAPVDNSSGRNGTVLTIRANSDNTSFKLYYINDNGEIQNTTITQSDTPSYVDEVTLVI